MEFTQVEAEAMAKEIAKAIRKRGIELELNKVTELAAYVGMNDEKLQKRLKDPMKFKLGELLMIAGRLELQVIVAQEKGGQKQ